MLRKRGKKILSIDFCALERNGKEWSIYMKKIFLKLLPVSIVTAISLMSCNNITPEKQETDNFSVNEIEYCYSVSDNPVFDANKISCFSLFDTYKNGFIFYGMRYSAREVFNVNIINTQNLNSDSVNLEINDPEIAISTIKKHKDEIIALSLYDGVYTIFAFDEEGKEKRRLDLDYYPGDIQFHGDRMYLMDYSNNKVKCYSQNFEYQSEYSISVNYNDMKYIPQFIRISDEGHIFCLLNSKSDGSYRIIQVDADNEINRSEINDMDIIMDFHIGKSGNILVMGKDNCESDKLLVDSVTDKGMVIDMFEINDCSEVYGITSADSIIFSNESGIYEYTENENKLIFDYGDNNTNIYSACIDGDDVALFLNDAVTCTDSIFIVDENNNIVDEYYTGPVNDAYVFNDDIYYTYQENHGAGVRCIKNNTVCDTGIFLEDSFVDKIAVLKNGDIILNKLSDDGTKSLISFNSEFEQINEEKTNIDIIDITGRDNNLLIFGDEKIYCTDSSLKAKTEIADISELNGNYKCQKGNSDYDFFIITDDDITGYTLSDLSKCLIARKSELLSGEVRDVIIDNSNRLIINQIMNIYTAHLSEQSSEQKNDSEIVLKLACFSDDAELDSAVKNFNSMNETCRIEVKKYNYENDEDSINRFDADILSGDIPDMIMFSEYLNISGYIRNNFFADLKEFLKDDSELNLDMMNEKIIEAFCYNDKLYLMPAFYKLETIASSLTNDGKELSEYFGDIVESQSPFVTSIYSQNFLDIITVYLSDKNMAGLKVSQEDIIKLVQLYEKYYEQFQNPEYEFVSEYPELIHWFNFNFGSPSSFYMNSGYDEFEDYDVGYSDELSGTVYPRMGFLISEKSQKKEAAWDFIKYIVDSPNILNRSDEAYFSILKKYEQKPNPMEMTKVSIDKYNSILNGKWFNIYYNYDINKIIWNELYNDDGSDVTEKSRHIMSALSKYYYEVN